MISLSLVFALMAALLLIQLMAVQRMNPPSIAPLDAPPQVQTVLTRACYDCHSNQTRWPWYSRVAPVSWWIARDVAHGREQVNFSTWGTYLPRTRRHKLQWMGRALRNHAMPPLAYCLMHPDARLSEEDRRVVENWVRTQLGGLSPREQGHSE